MGSSYELTCTNCGYTKTFRVGIGFMYDFGRLFDFDQENSFLANIVKTQENYNRIKELIVERYATVAPDFGHEIYRCNHCGEFHGGFYLHLDYEEGSFETEYYCPDCGRKLERAEYEESDGYSRCELDIMHEKYHCPKCCEYSLERAMTFINWD